MNMPLESPRGEQPQLPRPCDVVCGPASWDASGKHEEVACDKQFPSRKHPGNNPCIKALQIKELQTMVWKLHLHEISIFFVLMRQPRELRSSNN